MPLVFGLITLVMCYQVTQIKIDAARVSAANRKVYGPPKVRGTSKTLVPPAMPLVA